MITLAILFKIFGWILKIAGVGLGIPAALRQYKSWREKESSKLWAMQHFYVRTGRREKIRFWKRCLYKMCRMPLPHLWFNDDAAEKKRSKH